MLSPLLISKVVSICCILLIVINFNFAIGNEECIKKCGYTDSSGECSNRITLRKNEISHCHSVTKIDDSACKTRSFHTHSSETSLSTVKLKAFVDKSCNLGSLNPIGLNITLSNIQWTYFRYRCKPLECDVNWHCEEFNLSHPVPETTLYRDCFWSGASKNVCYEGSNYSFEYEASENEAGKLLFRMPTTAEFDENTTLESWKVFLYIDTNKVSKVYWQPAPERFNVTRYKVCHSGFPFCAFVDAVAGEEELSYDFSERAFGEIYFTVQIEHGGCGVGGCAVSESPPITIDDFPFVPVIAVITCVAILLIALIAFYNISKYYFTFGKPVLLIIYRPTLKTHVNAVVALTEHLNSFCQIEALVDVLDIPKSSEKDPFKWCDAAFDRAESVMVLSSPPPVAIPEDSIYRNVAAVGFRLLEENFFDNNNCRRFFTVLLPYCNETDLPIKNLKCFKLIDNWNEMLLYIHHGVATTCLSKIKFFLFKSKLPGGSSNLLKNDKKLMTALADAKEEVDRAPLSTTPISDPKSRKMDTLNEIPVRPGSDTNLLVAEGLFNNGTPSTNWADYPGDIQTMNLSGLEQESLGDSVPLRVTESRNDAGFDLDEILG